MAATTSRLLELLELLQDQPVTTGRQIAERLVVDRRTVRRYITALQELGIPVEGERGAGGGYRMRPGYRLPPLMLTGDEAVIIVLGLLGARRMGLGDADGALAKISRVLPGPLRHRVEALQAAVGYTAAGGLGSRGPAETVTAAETVLALAEAIGRRRRIRAGYQSAAGGLTARDLSPLGLVSHSGFWYLAAHDHARRALRTFRLDRMQHVVITDLAAAEVPADFDAVTYVSRSLARLPYPFEIEVLLDAPPSLVAPRLPATMAELTATADGTRLIMRVTSLDWMASVLAGLDCGFTIRRPDELRDSVRALARRLTAAAGPAPGAEGQAGDG
jgi:predicted DNA-binding transcriptional regulator YafY